MHSSVEVWPAPAKINLFLHITGQRADGYHLLQTAFQLLDFYDELRFSIRDDSQINRLSEVPDLPAENDLCIRAAQLLQRQSGTTLGVDIELSKRIPMGGGLGGGSSDAATTLVALNKLWRIGYKTDRLAKLGLQLGADVPFFVFGQTAWAEGVGEVLQAMDWEEPWYVLVLPPVHVSTKEVFTAPNLTRLCPAITIRDLARGRASNVCEPVVRGLYPEVDQALQWLSQFAQVHMTGTGACVFARFDSKSEADSVCDRFTQEMPVNWRAFASKGLNRSPLLDLV